VRLLRQAEGPLLVPSPVLGEVRLPAAVADGPQAEATFLKSVGGDGETHPIGTVRPVEDYIHEYTERKQRNTS